ncbi:MAG TPA: TAXI family TRAP transporter solute-binding subunit [Chloroflexota bacterium]
METGPRLAGSNLRNFALMQIGLRLAEDRSDPARPYRDARIEVGRFDDGRWRSGVSLLNGTPDLAIAVGKGELDVASINPSSFLTMAYRGTGPYAEACPVRTLAVMPSFDRMGFAVAAKTGVQSLAEVKERRVPLKISVRGNLAHATRFLVDQVLDADGFSLKDIESWGGSLVFADSPSEPARLEAITSESIDAVFDEGIGGWAPLALQHGMKLLTLSEAALTRLETLGWAVGPITPAQVPGLSGEVMAASFSGWPIFTHADLAENAAYQICRALDRARPSIPFDIDEPAELKDLCTNNPATDLDVPLHPGAERYYREHGAL